MPLTGRKRELLCKAVIERDGGLCISCGRMAADIHHIIPRSRGIKYSPKIWREENMACLCLGCHSKAQTTTARLELLAIMAQRYDMEWTREFGVALEEEGAH